MKIISKRTGEEPILEGATRLQKLIGQLRGKPLVPRGVYRFNSFEEADQWMIKMIANTHARLNSKTLSTSAHR